jgi:cyanophycinase
MLERIQRFMTGKGHLWVFLCFVVLCPRLPAQSYKYVRTGNATDAHTHPQFGIAMMGGGSDLDEAFRWLCSKVDGGDFLVVRAAGDDDYNSYIAGLCRVNSVATLIIPDRASALDPEVTHIILNAEAVFIAGGDQARYINFWKDTPVQDALNANISAGKPISGTSAGLAVLGEFIYGALQDKPGDNDLSSPEVLRDPYFHRVTIVRNFLKLSLLSNTLTDSHFAKRDRMGRSLGFLARIVQNDWSAHPREIAIDENSAILVEADGRARIIGGGRGAYFLSATKAPEVCRPQKPLTSRDVRVYHASAGASFELNSWTGAGGENYSLSVISGEIRSTKPGIY